MVRNLLFFSFLLWLTVQHVSGQTGTDKPVSRNDHIFPSAQQAKPYIDYDSKGFIINGKRTFIVSAGIEYARVPRGLWRDRLLKLKRGGFNAVEVYTFWNFHEPVEGKFDFSGDQDLDAFLKLVDELKMYAIVRVGPYYCGEWSLGGFPIWLKFKPGLRVRENNSLFLTAVGNFFDKLIPIVTANQVNHGGSVIMVQLENEHRGGWGTIMPDGYFKFLIDKTVSLGLQVPYFFSGLHPGNDPAGNLKSLDDPRRPNPWFSTEYWGIWFSNYGPQPQDSTIYDRRTWKIIARGGNGYNVYMAHGGSNFDYNNDRDMAASYDYGAAVGQTGDLRPIYYGFKRAAWFARSFQDILANSLDDTGNKNISSATNTSLVINARSGPAGTITFLDNPAADSAETKINSPANLNLPGSDLIKIAPGEIMPVVQNYALTTDIKLVWAPVRIYSIIPQENTTTLLVYGETGSPAKLYFDILPKSTVRHNKQNFKVLSSGILEFSSSIPSSAFKEYVFETGGHRIRILTVNNQSARRAWFVEAGGITNVVLGPAYAGEAKTRSKLFSLITERAWQDSSDVPVWVFKPSGAPFKMTNHNTPGEHITMLKLRTWRAKDASEAILPEYDDSSWTLSDEPLQMGADGDISANAWYRTKITVPEAGKYTLQFKDIRERASLFLDGKWIHNAGISKKAVELDLQANKIHHLTVFAAHNGRNKLIFYVGPPDTIDAKGLTGPVTLKKVNGSGALINLTGWRMKGGPGDPDSKYGWMNDSSKQATNTPRFFKTKFTLPALKGTHPVWRLITTSLSYGSVWVNGHNLGRYPEKIKINGLYIPESWLKKGINTLLIFDENGVNPGKVSVQAEVAASRDITIFIESNRLK